MSDSSTQNRPVITVAIKPRLNGDSEKLQRALRVLVREDPILRFKTQ